jgi:hypothetical protein
MEITYRNWEPNQGLEDAQAKIFNQANPGRNVTGKEIQERFEQEKIDPKTVRYAFQGNEPLAYVQARDYPQAKQIHIGRTWAMPNCPKDIQTKMYDDLLGYLKSRETDFQIKFNTTSDDEAVAFATERGFKEEQKMVQFTIDLTSLAKFDFSTLTYSLRKAEESDFDGIVSCYLKAIGHLGRDVNPRLADMFKTKIKEGYFTIVFEGDEMIGACAPRIPEENAAEPGEFLGVGPMFTLVNKVDALPFLMKSTIEKCQGQPWARDAIRVGFTDENAEEMAVMNAVAKIATTTGILFGL